MDGWVFSLVLDPVLLWSAHDLSYLQPYTRVTASRCDTLSWSTLCQMITLVLQKYLESSFVFCFVPHFPGCWAYLFDRQLWNKIIIITITPKTWTQNLSQVPKVVSSPSLISFTPDSWCSLRNNIINSFWDIICPVRIQTTPQNSWYLKTLYCEQEINSDKSKDGVPKKWDVLTPTNECENEYINKDQKHTAP